ncbi:hypothetical protein FB451DRAFT_330278 [Mycena latifolia]|nr:hypothetical protein FB451DRAFT_330278 [Mycena latifolia]
MGDYEAEFVSNLETAKQVYSTVRDEFYAWKGEHIAQVFRRTFNSKPPSTSSDGALESFPIPPAAFGPVPLPPGAADSEPCIYSWDYDVDGKITTPGERTPIIVVEPLQLIAHPPYQLCTAAARNHLARMIDNKLAPFIPYPEDPEFPSKRYLSSFKGFQWHEDQWDPDDEVIQYETVRRLHVEQGFSAETIDDTLRDNLRRLRLSNESGLLWDVSQRDLPNVIWGPSLSKPQLPSHFAQEFPAPNDIFTHINHGLAKFCPNLNCIMHCCRIHISPDWNLYTPALAPQEPHLTSDDLLEQSGEACGDDCFRLIDADMDQDASSIDNLEFLRGVLKLGPDTLPCDLAIICKLPCRDIFFHRRDLIDDSEISVPEPATGGMYKKRKGKRPKRLTAARKRETRRPTFSPESPATPCAHAGPCSARMGCECFTKNAHCERNCRCPPNCARRWKGCDASCASNPTCGKRCPCRVMGRECDPELCTACDARDAHVYYPGDTQRTTSTRCTNVDLQRAEFKRFHIQRSTYGLGAFASEPISKGDVIGEYVGELLDDKEEELRHRDTLQKHSGLNYCFGMDSTTVDAQWLGNPTRFLNDAMPHEPNCVADPVQVNGERRLIIRALKKIKEGGELTLSYGDDYWAPPSDRSGPKSSQ